MEQSPVKRWTKPRALVVLRVQDIGLNMRRITLGGPDLHGFPVGCNGAHIKLFLPTDKQTRPLLPEIGPDGPVWPDGPRPITRTYTVRRYDPQRAELDVDFVLHGDNGPASRWALRAQPGDMIGLAGPGGPALFLPDADHYLLAGDLSALPAIAAVLEQLPFSASGQAFIEVPDPADEQALIHPPRLDVLWLYNDPQSPQTSKLLDAIRSRDWPAGRLSITVAGESSSVVAIRKHLMVDRKLPRQRVYAVPYWRAGLSEEAYHDERHRIMDEETEAR